MGRVRLITQNKTIKKIPVLIATAVRRFEGQIFMGLMRLYLVEIHDHYKRLSGSLRQSF